MLAPLKIVALAVLGIAALLWPAGAPIPATAAYQSVPFSSGFVNGYLTMDTLGALVFGIVIVNAARSRGVKDAGLLTRYTILAGLIAGVGLTLVYLSLFKLGSGSGALVPDATNGAVILHAYVQNTFGGRAASSGGADLHRLYGNRGRPDLRLRRVLRAIPAVLVQDAGVYPGLFSMVVSNLGLSHLIQISIPVLTAIYPPCIVLVVLSFTLRWWHSAPRIIAPVMLVSLLFGILDAVKASSFQQLLPARPLTCRWRSRGWHGCRLRC